MAYISKITLQIFSQMFTGVVPVLTKGSFATFFGGETVIKEIEEKNKVDAQPSQVIPLFFIISSLFQMMMYVYKRIRTSSYKNIHSYISLLKKSLGMTESPLCQGLYI